MHSTIIPAPPQILLRDNYLSEFKSNYERGLARKNLGIIQSEDVAEIEEKVQTMETIVNNVETDVSNKQDVLPDSSIDLTIAGTTYYITLDSTGKLQKHSYTPISASINLSSTSAEYDTSATIQATFTLSNGTGENSAKISGTGIKERTIDSTTTIEGIDLGTTDEGSWKITNITDGTTSKSDVSASFIRTRDIFIASEISGFSGNKPSSAGLSGYKHIYYMKNFSKFDITVPKGVTYVFIPDSWNKSTYDWVDASTGLAGVLNDVGTTIAYKDNYTYHIFQTQDLGSSITITLT